MIWKSARVGLVPVHLIMFALLIFSPERPALAQATDVPFLVSTPPTGTNLGGSTSDTNNAASLSGLGPHDGGGQPVVSFTFSGSVQGGGLWNSGLSFIDEDTIQFQADATGLPTNFVDYTLDFTEVVYGLQFRFSGLDNADESRLTFFNNGLPVPVTVSTYNNGTVTTARPGNIVSFAGTNIDLDPDGQGFRVDGDGNNDANAIGGIHGFQEGILVSLPLDVAVDEVRLSQTGKRDGNSGNVTLILTDFAWARPDLTVFKSADDTTEVTAGQTILYTYEVENSGNVPLLNISLSEVHNAAGPVPTPGNEVLTSDSGPATGDSSDAGTDGVWDDLAPGDVVTFTGTYVVQQSDIDNLQ